MLEAMVALPLKSPYGALARRGNLGRLKDLQEQFQVGLVHSIAHSAGCLVNIPTIDIGADMEVTHCINNITDQMNIHLQLKTTTNGWIGNGARISTKLPKQRYDQMRDPNKHYPHYLVVMDLHPEIDQWYDTDDDGSLFRYKCYWADLTGLPPVKSNQQEVRVAAPVENIFSDAFLVDTFARLRQEAEG